MAARVSSPIMVARTDEIARLRAALGRAAQGQGSVVLLAGEAGVGKTRLATEFGRIAEDEGAVVLSGGCVVLGDDGLPYAPLVEALRGLIRITPTESLESILGLGRSELARVAPDLGPVTEGPASALSLASAQTRLFEVVVGVLERLAATAPVLLVVEDMHWSDRSTRDLVGFLVRNLRSTGVVLLLTYRSDELHRRHPLLPFVAELDRAGHVERIDLPRFDRAASDAQLRAIAGHDLDRALLESIHARTGGNAFFAEELLAAVGEGCTVELPPTLRDVLLARVADLSEPTQEFLRIASAAGQRVDPEMLAAAAGMDEGTVHDALRECVARQVLVVHDDQGGPAGDHYAFRHALLQEAIYDDLLPGERTRLHAAFARTLEASPEGGSRVAELAHHWHAAHELPRAFSAAIAAARAAEARYAFPEAVGQYERALDLWDQVPDADDRAGADRVEVLAALAGVARFHEPARAVAHIQAAIRLVPEATDPVRAGLLHERLGRYAWLAAQGGLALEADRAAMRLIPAEPPSESRARAVAGLAQILMLGGRFSESLARAEEALVIARSVGPCDIEGHALNTRGSDRAFLGDVDGGLVDMEAALALARELGIPDDVGRGHANRVWIVEMAGRVEEAVRLSQEGIAECERLSIMGLFGTHLLCGMADYLIKLGRWEEAERAVARADHIGPLGMNEILTRELQGRLAMLRGRFDEASERLRPLAALAERTADIQFIVPVQASLAELALWQGHPAAAAAQVAGAIPLVDHTGEVRVGELFALGLRANADVAELARVRRADGDVAAAVAAGERSLGTVQRRHGAVLAQRPAFERMSRAWLLLCEAEASRLHRAPDPDAWVAAAQAWDEVGRPYLAAYARWREAEARLATRGDREATVASLRAARDVAERLRAEPMLREIDALAMRARLDLGAPADAAAAASEDRGPHDEAARLGLTAREREVLELVAAGRTNRQIGEVLFISENTAGVHVSNILGKLGVAGRGEAAAIAYRLGLVAADAPVGSTRMQASV